MTVVVEKPRNGCALHGAVQTLSEIGGIVPIVHANGGCSVQNYLANRASGLAGGYVKGMSIPGTNFQERHIIFGGASRLTLVPDPVFYPHKIMESQQGI